MPRPEPVQKILDTLTGYQASAALAAAIELDLFTAIAAGTDTVDALAKQCDAAPRGVAALTRYLVADGFLTAKDGRLAVEPSRLPFLDRTRPTCLTAVSEFLTSTHLRGAFEDLTAAVRAGKTQLPPGGLMAADHPAWQAFARGMAGVAAGQAAQVAEHVDTATSPGPILDIAAGHGQYGIALARRWPEQPVTFQDWPDVVPIALELAAEAGVSDRATSLPGDVFELDLGGPYAAILVPNLLHHFSLERCTQLVSRIHAALTEGGLIAVVESLVHEDRTGPPSTAKFSLVMLATTEQGDAFTQGDVHDLLESGGFREPQTRTLGDSPQSLTLARK